MKIKRSMLGSLVDAIREEIFISKGPDKFLLFTLFANIPSPVIFIPYLTQAATIIFLCFYLSHLSGINTSQQLQIYRSSRVSIAICSLVVIAILLQTFWIPFMTQLYTLTLIGLTYALSKYWKT